MIDRTHTGARCYTRSLLRTVKGALSTARYGKTQNKNLKTLLDKISQMLVHKRNYNAMESAHLGAGDTHSTHREGVFRLPGTIVARFQHL
jgi:hypothetical protein